MGAIAPVLGTIGAIGSLAGNIASTKAKSDSDKQSIELQRKQNQLSQQAYEQDRKDALKRAVAKQRARIGASGSTLEGSGEAILLGLFDETDEELARREELDQLKEEALRQSSSGLYTRSLLDTSDIFSDIGKLSNSRLLS